MPRPIPLYPWRGLVDQASAHARDGRYAEASALAEKAIAIVEAECGADAIELIEPLRALASYDHDARARTDEALGARLAIEERALRIAARASPESALHAALLHDMGLTLWGLRRYDDAAAAIARALCIHDALRGDEHDSKSLYLGSLADTLREGGRAREALPHAERAVRIEDRGAACDDPSLMIALRSLALVQLDLGDVTAARAALDRAEAIAIARGLDGFAAHVRAIREARSA
jgi:tetratricopeptide (TPR) repeat protein